HDCFRAGATQLLIDRFQSSHRIALVEPGPRNASCYAALGQWTREDARLALSEARPFRQQWACLTPMQ
ncbi:MAG TPA: hypothetical protein VFL57_18050, partial [Bryobacteraceae bacterium]|nr:hypothetical protein [Bryobacteraceae bacterium]